MDEAETAGSSGGHRIVGSLCLCVMSMCGIIFLTTGVYFIADAENIARASYNGSNITDYNSTTIIPNYNNSMIITNATLIDNDGDESEEVQSPSDIRMAGTTLIIVAVVMILIGGGVFLMVNCCDSATGTGGQRAASGSRGKVINLPMTTTTTENVQRSMPYYHPAPQQPLHQAPPPLAGPYYGAVGGPVPPHHQDEAPPPYNSLPLDEIKPSAPLNPEKPPLLPDVSMQPPLHPSAPKHSGIL